MIEFVVYLCVLFCIFASLLFPISLGKGEIVICKKENSMLIKGIACIMVIISHVSIQLDGPGVLNYVWNIGYLAVGIFYFFSGYGLMHSYISKENYLNKFLTSKLINIVIPFWIANSMYILQSFIVGEHFSALEYVKYFLGIKLICGHSWYIQSIIIFYLMFYLLGKVLRDVKKVFLGMTVLVTIYLIIIYIINYGAFWRYLLPFIIGMAVAIYREDMTRFITKKRTFIVATLFFSLMYIHVSILRFHIPIMNNEVLCDISSHISCICFMLMILWLDMKVKYGNKLLFFVGSISFNIYLVHQLVIDLLKYLLNDKLWIFVFSIIGSIVIGAIMNLVCKKIMNVFKTKKEIVPIRN